MYITKNPKEEIRLISSATSNKRNKYTIAMIKKLMSLRKNILVTLTLLGLTVLAMSNYMTDERKQVAPTSEHMLNKVLFGSGFSSLPPRFADIDAKTSGAPFPKASKVTPASDSFILNLIVRYSRVGAR